MLLLRVIAYVALSVAIIATELALASRARSPRAFPAALLTDQLMFCSTAVSLGGGLVFSLVLQPPMVQPALPSVLLGLLCGTGGVILRAVSMRSLSDMYSLTLRSDPSQKLVSTGPYRHIRHPGYAGILLAILGLQLIIGTWLSVALTMLVALTAPIRIRVEEDMLIARFGAEYQAYRDRTRFRMVPGLY